MNRDEKLNKKIRRLLAQAQQPRWLHRFGPKKFELWVLCLGLIIKQTYRLSYRRAMKFLDEYYSISIHWTTLQKACFRLPQMLWQSLLSQSAQVESVYLAAGDGTSFTRNAASHHYLKRIDRDEPVGRPVQMVPIIAVKERKFLSASFRAYWRNEIRPIKQAFSRLKTECDVLLLDKGFDAEHLHWWLYDRGTFAVIPVRKKAHKGMKRKVMRNCFDYCLYWQRNLVECLFSALKRLFGSVVLGRHIKTQSTELSCRMIAYNIGAII